MNHPVQNMLQAEAWKKIKSVTDITVKQAATASNKKQIDDNTPITSSYLNDSYRSFFKDDIWSISETQQINFSSGVEGLSSDEILEIKTLSYLFLEIPFPRSKGLYKTRLAPKTASIRTATLKALKKTDTLRPKPLISLFTDSNVSAELAKEIQLAYKEEKTGYSLVIANLQGLITHVTYLSSDYLDIKPIYSEDLNTAIQNIYKKTRAKSKQHTVIPPIIYSQIYADAISIIKGWDFDKFNNDAKNLISAYTNLSATGSNNHKPAGISRGSYQNRLDKFLNHEDKIYERAGNYEYFKNKIKSVGQVESSSFFYGSENITGITYEIRRVQAFLARLILQESTMRENELIHLLNEPTKIINTNKGIVFQIIGKETKISGGKRTGWVVSKNGNIAHKILRQLSDFSHDIQIVPLPSSATKWLFPTTASSLVDKSKKKQVSEWIAPDGRTTYYKASYEKPISLTSLFKQNEPDENDKPIWVDRTGEYIVSSADANFLHTYSTSKNRLNNNIQPDQPFSITEHQFRRSLPFYASGSGQLPASDLKFQLKHTALLTTFYYADGGRALQESGLLLDDDTYKELNANLVNDLEQTDTIARKDLVSIVDDSSRTLFGAGLKAVKQFTESINHSENPDAEWSDLAKEGAIKTKELPHGWCITTQPCDDYANQNFYQCFNCANGILDQDKSISLIQKTKEQAKLAKNEFNKKHFTNIATKLEETSLEMYPKLFRGK